MSQISLITNPESIFLKEEEMTLIACVCVCVFEEGVSGEVFYPAVIQRAITGGLINTRRFPSRARSGALCVFSSHRGLSGLMRKFGLRPGQ